MLRSPTKSPKHMSDPNLQSTSEKTWVSSRQNKTKRDTIKDSDSDTSQTSSRYKIPRSSSLNSIHETLNAFREELKSIHTLLSTMKDEQENNYVHIKSDISEIKSDILEIKIKNLESEKIVEDMNIKLIDLNKIQQDLTKNIEKQENKLKDLTQKSMKLENQLKDSTNNIQSLQHQSAMRDQRERLNNLEITGVPVSKSENLYTILEAISTKIGVPLPPETVDQIHRVRKFPTSTSTPHSSGFPPNIIIHFLQRRSKNEFLAAYKKRRILTTADLGLNGPSTPIYINDHLTPRNKLLLKQAREAGKEMGYKFIWIKDCKIFLRKSETSKIIHISYASDILKIK